MSITISNIQRCTFAIVACCKTQTTLTRISLPGRQVHTLSRSRNASQIGGTNVDMYATSGHAALPGRRLSRKACAQQHETAHGTHMSVHRADRARCDCARALGNPVVARLAVALAALAARAPLSLCQSSPLWGAAGAGAGGMLNVWRFWGS